ncbi:MAG: ferredoxin reductase [Caulobacteraceae bacterium]|nr:ferredoxin reductase [Caulobacteraceae bacterium]
MSQPTPAGVLILGAGHAGGSAAAFLRQYGHTGPITLIGEEPLAPYQRPPLSKAWLKGEADADELMLKDPAWYGENGIDLRLSATAQSLNRGARQVTLKDGAILAYEHLIIATGARARTLPLPGADLAGVVVLRNAADAEIIKRALVPGARLAVIGGGYVGLEVAASARALGAEATVIEREARVLARVACEPLSNFFQDYHRARGVAFELSAGVEAIFGSEGRAAGVRLASGRVVEADLVLIGVGAIPNDAIARDAGLECHDGIVVDLTARTADPAIFAIGDVTHRPLPLYDRMFRLESVPNALEQAKQAAAAIVGRSGPAPETPWFWSDQYDLKLQIAGLPFDVDSLVLRGDPASARFAVFHLKGDLIQAVEAVNAPPEYMMGRQMIGARRPIDRARLADPAISMKEVAL